MIRTAIVAAGITAAALFAAPLASADGLLSQPSGSTSGGLVGGGATAPSGSASGGLVGGSAAAPTASAPTYSSPISANAQRSADNFGIWLQAISTGTSAQYLTSGTPNNGRSTPYQGYAIPPIRGIVMGQ